MRIKKISFFVGILLLFCGFFLYFLNENKNDTPYSGKPIHVFYDGLATQPAFMGMIDMVQLKKDEIKIFAWHRFTNRSKLIDLKKLNAIEVPVTGLEGYGLANVSPVLEKLKEVLNENPTSPVVVWTNANNINYFFDLFFKVVEKERVKHIHLYEDGVGELFTYKKRFTDFSYTEQDIQAMNDYWFHPELKTTFPKNGRYLAHHLFKVTYHFFGLDKAKNDPELKPFFNKMTGAFFKENDFEKLKQTLSKKEKQNLYRLVGFDEEKYRKIFKDKKVIIYVGGKYPNDKHFLEHAEVLYIKELKKKYPDYAFLLKPHPSFDAFDKTKYIQENIPDIHIMDAQIPYEILHIAGLKPTKIAGRTSSVFYSVSLDQIEGFIAHPSYIMGLKTYLNLDNSKEINPSSFIPSMPYFYDAKIKWNNQEDFITFLPMGEAFLYQTQKVLKYKKIKTGILLHSKDFQLKMFQKDEKGVYQESGDTPVYHLIHPYWSDEVVLEEKNKYCRSQGDCGQVKVLVNGIKICWEQWGCETYEKKEDEKYYLKQ